jgi:hypothetical protein
MGAVSTVAALVKMGFPESVAKRIASGELPMDEASRLKRAAEQGYDTSRPVYHGTDTDFTEFDPDKAAGTQFWSTTNKEAVESGEVGAAGHGVIKEMYHKIQNPAEWDDYENLLLDEISARGHDGLKLSDPDGHATMVAFDPKQYKSVDAAFDPQYIGPNMLGNATPGFMAMLAAGGAGATAAARGSHPVSQQAGQLWDDLKGTAQGLLDVAEMPARGLQGLGRVGYGMLSGEGFDEAMRQGNDVLQGGTEAAAKRVGDEVFKRTGSAEMAAAAYTAVMTGSPI